MPYKEKYKDSKSHKDKDKYPININGLNYYSPFFMDLTLQRTIGNQEVLRMLKTGEILAKLFVNQPGDVYEQEADRVARKIVNMGDNEAQVKTSDIKIQKKGTITGSDNISSRTEAGINSLKGKGKPLEPKIRDYFQPRFGVDLKDVRIHTDSNADRLARAIRARAFTLGNDVVFAKGEYKPETHEGKKLVAHELTHVLQQEGVHTFKQENVNRLIVMRQTVSEEITPSGGTPINKIGIVFNGTGAELYESADNSKYIKTLSFNTRIQVNQEFYDSWYHITTIDGEIGYVDKNYIWTHLPEPNAFLHRIEEGEGAQEIARKYFNEHTDTWGQDERFFVNVLVNINDGVGNPNKGIYKENEDDQWDETKTKAGFLIWIPSPYYALSLKGIVSSGSISYGMYQGIRRVGQLFEDVVTAIGLCGKYLPDAIGRYVVPDLIHAIIGLAIALVGSILLIALFTAIGGAAGFIVITTILKWLGLSLLITWGVSQLISIGGSFINFLSKVGSANGDKDILEEAAYELAEYIAKGLSTILQILLMFAVAKGIAYFLNWIKTTKFGKVMGEKFNQWITRNYEVTKWTENFKNNRIAGDYDLTVELVSPDSLPPNKVGNGILQGNKITIRISNGQSYAEIKTTFWHEIIEIGAIEGKTPLIDLSHLQIENMAQLFAKQYGLPESINVLNNILKGELGF